MPSRFDARQRQDFQIGGIGQRHILLVHPQRRRIQIVEGVLDHPGHDLGPDAHRPPAFLGRDQTAGLLDALDDGLVVQRAQGAQVDDLAADALLRQLLGGLQGKADHAAVGGDGDVGALAADLGLADRHDIVLDLRHIELDAVHHLVLEEDDGVGIADGGLQQALGIGGVIGGDDLQAGDVGVPGGIVLAVLGTHAAGGAVRPAEHDAAPGSGRPTCTASWPPS